MMTDKELKKVLESEMLRETAQHYRLQNSEHNHDICANCMHAELKLSEYSSVHKICSVGGFVINETMTCDQFEKIKTENNAEQK